MKNRQIVDKVYKNSFVGLLLKHLKKEDKTEEESQSLMWRDDGNRKQNMDTKMQKAS